MIYAPAVKLQRLARGLWRWTAPHPDWEPPKEKDSPADWERDVGCVAYEAADALPGMMTADDVAEVVVFVLERPRRFRMLETAFRPMTEPSWG